MAKSYLFDGKKILIQRKNLYFEYPRTEDRETIVNQAHSLGHFQAESTYNRLKDEYYWHGMVNYINQFVKQCTVCQRNNKCITKYHPAQATKISKIFTMVAIDLILGLDETEDGYIGILVIIEFLTNFPVAKPIKSKSAKEIAEILSEYITLLGQFSELLSYQGREFLNQIMSELRKNLGFVHIVTSAYNPRTNGKTEIFNQTLMESLRKHAEADRKNWPKYLQFVLMAYRSRVHTSTGFTPFELMAKEIENLFDNLHPKAIESGKVRQMEIQNRSQNTTLDIIPLGSTVFLKCEVLLGKLEPRFKGPYKIVEQIKRGNNKVENALKETLPESLPRHKIKMVQDHKSLPEESAEVEKIIKNRNVDNNKYYLANKIKEPILSHNSILMESADLLSSFQEIVNHEMSAGTWYTHMSDTSNIKSKIIDVKVAIENTLYLWLNYGIQITIGISTLFFIIFSIFISYKIYKWKTSNQNGVQRYYCRFIEHGCRAALCLEELDDNRCKFKESHSNHSEQTSPKKKKDSDVMKRIKELHSLGIKPQAIISRLFKEGLEAPSITKIYNLTKELRKAKTISSRPTIRQIVEWCNQYKEIPEDENEVFFGNFEYESIETQTIRVFLTTKNLLKYALKTDFILSDATYKLTFAGFPVLTGGNTDRAKSFHPFGIALCSCQTSNDFSFFFRSIEVFKKEVFQIEKRVTCWAHVRRNIDDELKIFDDKIKSDIFEDIYSIQELFREDFFTQACELFEKKWINKNSNVDSFLKIFKKNYVLRNNGWSEGYCNGIPSSTNALESTHAKIKDFIKTRLGLLEFLNVCKDNLVRFWSQIHLKEF
ncbi:unnamed protein product [Brachionus calyciflorus]|uniref:Integrase catalytic domain-containing protein n=1 Tax=Brachionus calyciflorus TaxID=104777 RepID=A0A813VZL3_9BILA|nr:unnamed protein product [Brachionus calyciflorus]